MGRRRADGYLECRKVVRVHLLCKEIHVLDSAVRMVSCAVLTYCVPEGRAVHLLHHTIERIYVALCTEYGK